MASIDSGVTSAADPFVPQLYRVVEVQQELADTTTLKLVPLSGGLLSFEPGQFNMLYAFGNGEVAISVSGDAAGATSVIHTVRDVGPVSRTIGRLQPGAVVGLRGPFGTGWPMTQAEGMDVLLVAGGLGLAPLRPAIYAILANRRRFGRVGILFGSRSPKDILYRGELQAWRQRLDVDIEVTVDHADAEWRGSVGVVPALIPYMNFDPHETVALVCGPEVMMRFTVTALLDQGVASNRIYLSMERNMKCAIGLCGHCQFGPTFVCRDGPVMRHDKIANFLSIREV